MIGLDENNQLQFRRIAPDKAEPLERELSAFLRASADRGPVASSPAHVRRTLETALRIRAEMRDHAEIVRATVAEHEAMQRAK